MPRQTSTMSVLGEPDPGDELASMFRKLFFMDFLPDELATVKICDEEEKEQSALHRTTQVGNMPSPRVARSRC